MEEQNEKTEPISSPTAVKGPGPVKRFFISTRDLLVKTTNGMAIGLFGTLIIGTIIGMFAKIPGLSTVGDLANIIKGLMGAGIGLGVALSLKLGGVELVSVMAAGAPRQCRL